MSQALARTRTRSFTYSLVQGLPDKTARTSLFLGIILGRLANIKELAKAYMKGKGLEVTHQEQFLTCQSPPGRGRIQCPWVNGFGIKELYAINLMTLFLEVRIH